MNTAILTTEYNDIQTAADVLKNGGLVAFPTETVYGLGGNALSPESSNKIYAAKGRPSDNPLIVHIADTASVYEIAANVPDTAKLLMEAFWPGPLTIILPKKNVVPDETTGGLKTVAIRMPSHPAALDLIRESGVLIAAPSANTSGRPSPTTAEHVVEDMNGRIDAIIDGGPVGIGIESTIVDLTEEIPTILRPGFVTKKMLEAVIGEVSIDRTLIEPDPNIRPKAPGMKYTHYAPSGELTIVEYKKSENSEQPDTIRADKYEADKMVADKINELLQEGISHGKKVVILSPEEHAGLYPKDSVITVGSIGEGVTVAARLYAALRECDKIGAELIYSESLYLSDLGGAIMNRLLKAAGHRVIYVSD
jgi:L-threonylcarbamoyladenylate synthase